jgi:hypothetical protein
VSARIGVQWARLDGSHPDPSPVPNEHIVSLDWVRVLMAIGVPLGGPWDAGVELPYDIKRVRVRYELPDGTPFDNPLGDLHHRDETLEGVGDLTLLLNLRGRDLLLAGDFGHAGLGFTLPTGRTEEDPYALAALGFRHQHIQFGTGTVDPVLRLDYAWQSGAFGADVSFSLRLPFYENAETYEGASQADLALGPRVAILPWLSASLHYTVGYQTRAFWDGVKDPNTGYAMHSLALTLPIRLSPQVAIMPTVVRVLSIDTRGSGDTFEMDWSVTVSVDVAVGK